jgi:hypothetical protein
MADWGEWSRWLSTLPPSTAKVIRNVLVNDRC